MDNRTHTSFNATDRSYFSILKKEIHNIVIAAGFNEARAGVVDIIVAEMTSNLVKHAGGGEVLIRCFNELDNDCIEIISIDNGPGMADPMKMVEDGMSTSNTLGQGLGAIKRLSDHFQIYSLKNWGTIILSRVYKDPLPHFRRKLLAEVRAVVVAKPGEAASGDGYCCKVDSDYLKVFLGDGLGHGQGANSAVSCAIKALQQQAWVEPIETLRQMHLAVKKTRGLVGTTAIYSFKEKLWRICGIGNIATRMQTGLTARNYMSYNGIIGLNVPNTMKEQEVAGAHGQLVIMCSDGIRTRWDLLKYPGILKTDLTIIAAAIYKDHARKTDDMAVVVSRINRSS